MGKFGSVQRKVPKREEMRKKDGRRSKNRVGLGGERKQAMKIRREKIKQCFNEYVRNYNLEDPKVKLKVAHTYRVSEISEEIAGSINLSKEDCEMAWFIGMLHDIGRFEQLRRYNTFIDSESVNHALLGCEILFEERKFDDFILGGEVSKEEENLIHTAIAQHSLYRIGEELDERTKLFCNILRDADKIDIIRVNVETPLEDIYNVSTEELRNCEVTEKVMDSFMEMHATKRDLKMAPVDHVVGHISLAFELVFPKSRQLIKQQGYLDQIMNFESNCEKTGKQFEQIRNCMGKFLEMP